MNGLIFKKITNMCLFKLEILFISILITPKLFNLLFQPNLIIYIELLRCFLRKRGLFCLF